jgi:hypothetical protein
MFFIYENWVAEGHKVRIHYGSCSFFKDGRGIYNSDTNKNGQWLSPYSTYKEAFNVA